MGTVGAKYNTDLDIKEIAKLVRKDIKAAVKAGSLPKEMKVSVRVKRYSGGQSLNLNVKSFPGGFLNPAYVKAVKVNPHLCYTEYPPRYYLHVSRALTTLDNLANAYNYNNSDTMVDYFDVNYYVSVNVDVFVECKEREKIEALL
jgi:hypothetical protein